MIIFVTEVVIHSLVACRECFIRRVVHWYRRVFFLLDFDFSPVCLIIATIGFRAIRRRRCNISIPREILGFVNVRKREERAFFNDQHTGTRYLPVELLPFLRGSPSCQRYRYEFSTGTNGIRDSRLVLSRVL